MERNRDRLEREVVQEIHDTAETLIMDEGYDLHEAHKQACEDMISGVQSLNHLYADYFRENKKEVIKIAKRELLSSNKGEGK